MARLTPQSKRALQEQSLSAINQRSGPASRFLKFVAISRTFFGCPRVFKIYKLGFWYCPKISDKLHICFLPMLRQRHDFEDWNDRMMKLNRNEKDALYRLLNPNHFYLMN